MPLDQKYKQPAIIFDLGGVLIDWNPRYLFGPMFNGDEAEVDYFLSVVCPLEWNEEQDAGRLLTAAMEERSQVFPDYAPYIQAYYTRWEEMIGGVFTGTVNILSAIRDNGYPLYALSNWSSETFPLVQSRFEFLNWFDELIISGQVKVAKPDPAIYKLLLDRIHRPPDQCLFIDDSERNILVADRLGFQTIHFSSPDLLLADLMDRKLI